MDLVVGRVVKAHGITGEVVVDVRTDDPDARFAPGRPCCAGQPAAAAGARLSSSSRRASTVAGCWCGWTASATATPPTHCAARCSSSTPTDLPPIEDPDEFYDHQLEGLRVRTAPAGRRHGRRGAAHRGGRIAVGQATTTAPRCWCRSSAPSSRRCRWTDGTVEIDPPEGLLDLD